MWHYMRISSHLLKKSLMENFIFYAVLWFKCASVNYFISAQSNCRNSHRFSAATSRGCFLNLQKLVANENIYILAIQTRNQEFFWAGEVSWNRAILINVLHITYKRRALQGKICWFFLQDTFKTHLKWKFNP